MRAAELMKEAESMFKAGLWLRYASDIVYFKRGDEPTLDLKKLSDSKETVSDVASYLISNIDMQSFKADYLIFGEGCDKLAKAIQKELNQRGIKASVLDYRKTNKGIRSKNICLLRVNDKCAQDAVPLEDRIVSLGGRVTGNISLIGHAHEDKTPLDYNSCLFDHEDIERYREM